MRFESQAYWMPKDLEDPAQYQDAFAFDPERGIAAIADGVSSAIFSGSWARLLVQATVQQPLQLDQMDQTVAWLAEQRAGWLAQIDVSRLTWYQRPKMVDGAMSTLLWIELLPAKCDPEEAFGYSLRCFAIGDCCLFHVRTGQTLCSFPIQSASEFGLNPDVIGSIDRKQDHLLKFHCEDLNCQANDLLVLCTDAIGQWALDRHEAGDPVDWESYWSLPPDIWREETLSLQRAKRMRFDDTTLVLLRVLAADVPAENVEPAPVVFESTNSEAMAEPGDSEVGEQEVVNVVEGSEAAIEEEHESLQVRSDLESEEEHPTEIVFDTQQIDRDPRDDIAPHSTADN